MFMRCKAINRLRISTEGEEAPVGICVLDLAAHLLNFGTEGLLVALCLELRHTPSKRFQLTFRHRGTFIFGM